MPDVLLASAHHVVSACMNASYSWLLGWTRSEIALLRAALIHIGIGQPNLIATRYLQHKTAAQINLQTQKMCGQQSLAGNTCADMLNDACIPDCASHDMIHVA